MGHLLPGALELLRDNTLNAYGETITYEPVDGEPVTFTAVVTVEQEDFGNGQTAAVRDVARVLAAVDPNYTLGGVRPPFTGDRFYRDVSVDPPLPGDEEQRAFVYSHDAQTVQNGVFWEATFNRRNVRVAGRGGLR